MNVLVIYSLLGIFAVFLPLYLLFLIGPKFSKRRGLYGLVGILTAASIGLILNGFAIDERLGYEDFQGRLVRGITAAIVEEIIRYPGILFAVWLTKKVNLFNEEIIQQPALENAVEGDFTTIVDPHGMGLYFGTAYGLGETIAFYVYPTVEELIDGDIIFNVGDEITQILFRITAVIAHIALTYLAMAITSQRGFWRLTILLHLGSNISNSIFLEFTPNTFATIVFVILTRSAILVITYFLLRPRVRYLSPAVLVLLLVSSFLLVILISTFIAILVGFIKIDIINPY